MEKYEIIIDDVDFEGLVGLSIVDNPAIETMFVKMSEEEKSLFELASIDEEKRIITGPALIPNKEIPRIGDNGETFSAFYSEDTIRQCVELFFKKGKNVNITLQHQMDVSDVVMFESWIIEDELNDKSNKYGYKLPTGTWMVSMKVYNDDMWNLIKQDIIRGFSIEGWFSKKLTSNKTNMSNIDNDISEDEFFRELEKIIDYKK